MFENLFTFNGRIRRTEYSLSLLFYIAGITIINVIVKEDPNMEVIVLGYIPLSWFLWAQGAKRCHDNGNSGWMQLVPLYVLWMIFQEGDTYTNAYGSNSKADYILMPAENIKTNNTSVINDSVEEENTASAIIKKVSKSVIAVEIPTNQLTVLEVNNVNYSLIQDLLKKLRTLELTNNLSYEFLGTGATISIFHRNTSQVLLENLCAIVDNMEVLGVSDGSLNIKIK